MRSSGPHRYRGASVLAQVAALALLAGCGSDDERLAVHVERARAARDRGEHAAAAVDYRSALKLAPHRPDLHYELALSLLEAGRGADGSWELHETIRLDPGNLDARLRLGWIALAAGDTDEAFEQADAILAADPEHLEAPHLRVATLLAAADFDAAAEAATAYLVDRPDDPRAHYHLARALAGLGRHDEAREALFRYHRLDGGSPEATREVLRFFGATGQSERAEPFLRRALDAAAPAARADLVLTLVDLLAREAREAEAETALRSALEGAPERLDVRERLALVLVAAGRDDEALALLEQVRARHGDDPVFHRAAGDVLLAAGHPGEALAAYREGLRLAPERPDLRLREADALMQTGALEESASRLRELVEERPSDPGVALASLRAMALEGRSEEAIEALRAMVGRDPDLGAGHYLLGVLLLVSDRPAEAVGSLALAAELASGPSKTSARRVLAEARLRAGEFEQAASEAEALLAADAGDLRARLLLAEARLSAGDSEGAEAILVDADEGSAAVHAARARVLVRQGRLPEAQAQVERAFALEPDSIQRSVDLVWVLQQQGRHDEALAHARERMLAHPERPDDANLFGQALLRRDSDEEARRAFQRAVDVDPGFVPGWINLALVDERAGRLDAARAHLLRALEVDPTNAVALRALGTVEYRAGRPAEAAGAFEAALRADPGSEVTRANLARARADAGRDLDEALELARAIRRAEPSNPGAAEALGRVLERKGLHAAAAEQYRAAIASAPHPIAAYHFRLGMALVAAGDEEGGGLELERALEIDDGFSGAAEVRRQLEQLERKGAPPP
jgi:tetratricopeptide (TPR) repeat protein